MEVSELLQNDIKIMVVIKASDLKQVIDSAIEKTLEANKEVAKKNSREVVMSVNTGALLKMLAEYNKEIEK